MRSVFKFKNYDVHSITTKAGEGINANIATWVMQSAMKGKYVTVALYNIDYTIKLVEESKILNINLLSTQQTNLIAKLGRRTGRDINKFTKLPHAFDERGCPYLTEAIGYIQCETEGSIISGDHTLFVCKVLKQQVLNKALTVLTNNYLKEEGIVRA